MVDWFAILVFPAIITMTVLIALWDRRREKKFEKNIQDLVQSEGYSIHNQKIRGREFQLSYQRSIDRMSGSGYDISISMNNPHNHQFDITINGGIGPSLSVNHFQNGDTSSGNINQQLSRKMQKDLIESQPVIAFVKKLFKYNFFGNARATTFGNTISIKFKSRFKPVVILEIVKLVDSYFD